MLEELFKQGYIDYQKLILDYSKVLGLGAEEAFILIKILDNYHKNQSLSIEELQNQILISSAKMDKVLAALMERGYYEIYLIYDQGVGKESVSFRPLFDKLEAVIYQKTDLDSYDIEKANQYISTKLNRVLTASELEILQGLMVEDHYTLTEIKEAVDRIKKDNRSLSMRSITMSLGHQKKEIESRPQAPQAFQDFLKKI